ncbi:MAG: ribonuclease HIII [Melioribacteraceae bacterium]|nr:ribonuclease HIII [Melioribacteraceae bacterium]MCF8356877.1 ribonuclease HIII [Melioribacteraceae bacterium]MCF8395193.1 ribonuclease HIII [Melioribacteraceae bacterium]MCF8420037.1 ribonuclease HIII [Melioribacteraceae bacterium]
MSQNNLERQAASAAESHINELNKYNFQTSDLEKKQYHYQFEVRSGNEKIKILVYFGKKGVKTLLQGNNQSPLYQEINDIVTGNFLLNFKQTDFDEPAEYIGSDETGKGDFFGPLVTAAVFVNKEDSKILKSFGVRDSKELSAVQIEQTAKKTLSVIKDKYEVVLISPEKYNQLYEKFQNINKILKWSHKTAIMNLIKRHKANTVIIDKFTRRGIDLQNELIGKEIIETSKAERYTAVAAASIIARQKFDGWFLRKKREGFDLPKGSSNNTEDIARELIQNNPNIDLSKLAKLHFKTYKKINS